MNLQWIIRGLGSLVRNFRRIIEDDASTIIEEAIADIETSKELHDSRKRQSHHPGLAIEPWGYEIDPNRPLRFKPSIAIKGLETRIDVFSTVKWTEEGKLPVKQNTHLRLWSNSDLAFRETLDAKEIQDKLIDPSRTHKGRVMWRGHFDLAHPGQAGPKYHLQFGGNAPDYELCWFPEIIDIPRLLYPPMDLLLACQLVAANFFWEEYCDFRETPEWTTVLQYSQEHFLQSYYEECLQSVTNKRPLLDHLWNV